MNSRSHPRTVLRPGDPFNPWKQFDFNLQVPIALYGFVTVRDRISSRPNDKPQPLSDSAKLLYSRLIYYGGKKAECFPLLKTLVDERGVSISTIKRWLQELEDYKFIRIEKNGPHSANYIFLWHEALSGSQEDSPKLSCLQNQTAQTRTEDSSILSGLDSSKLSAPYKEEKIPRKDSLKRASGQTTGIVQTTELPRARSSPSSDPENQTPPGTPEARSKRHASEKRPDRQAHSGKGDGSQVTNQDAELIEAVLADHHVKIFPNGIVRELLKAAALEGANACGLADFIVYKCTSAYNGKSGRLEVASFFRKAIPEDMPSWIVRNGERLSRRGGLIGPGSRSPSHGTPETQNATSAVRTHLLMCAKQLRQIGSYEEIAVEIDRIISNANAQNDVEQLEQRLSDLERRMTELTQSRLSAEETSRIQGEINAKLAVFRAKMTVAQIDMLEHQYYTKLLFERAGLPWLSLFYMREKLSRAA